MSYLKSIFIVFSVLTSYTIAQQVTHGPIVGGVTDSSAVFVLRTDSNMVVRIQVSQQLDFTSSFLSDSAITATESNYFARIAVQGLLPETNYHYRALINGNPVIEDSVRSFRTFPIPGKATKFVFHTGSGQQNGSDPNSNQGTIFPQMAAELPAFMLHQGDWGYPDTTDNEKGQPGNYFSLDFNKVIASYMARYNPDYPMSELLRLAPVAYTYDDHDMIDNNSDGFQFPWAGIANSIRGYQELFPGYPLPNPSKGIWHKFSHGNTDIFMIDNRSQRSPNTGAFDFSNPDSVIFTPGSTHSILGPEQMDWLLQELSNSSADWKFISSGTPINPAILITIEIALQAQGIIDRLPVPGGGFITPVEIAIELADKWAGFPADITRILEYIYTNEITNVILLSGDTHTSGIDNGQNSILPELMAGGLDRTNGQILKFLSLFGVEIWNSGGHTADLPDEKFGNAYGRITVFADDSVALEAIAEGGDVLGRYVVQNGILPSPVGATVAPLIGLDFGKVPIGSSTSLPLFIASTSFDSLRIENISISGDSVFSIDSSSNSFPFSIAAADMHNVLVHFIPIVSGKTSEAVVGISTNDPDNALFSIPLRGIAGQSTQISENAVQPSQFQLRQNFPNPFNPTTTIHFTLAQAGHIRLEIFNIMGQRITELLNRRIPAGEYQIPFNAIHLPAGIYFYRLAGKTNTAIGKMVLLK